MHNLEKSQIYKYISIIGSQLKVFEKEILKNYRKYQSQNPSVILILIAKSYPTIFNSLLEGLRPHTKPRQFQVKFENTLLL